MSRDQITGKCTGLMILVMLVGSIFSVSVVAVAKSPYDYPVVYTKHPNSPYNTMDPFIKSHARCGMEWWLKNGVPSEHPDLPEPLIESQYSTYSVSTAFAAAATSTLQNLVKVSDGSVLHPLIEDLSRSYEEHLWIFPRKDNPSYYGNDCYNEDTIMILGYYDDGTKIHYWCPCYEGDGIKRFCAPLGMPSQGSTKTRCWEPSEHPAACSKVGNWTGDPANPCCGDGPNERWDSELRICCTKAEYDGGQTNSCCDPALSPPTEKACVFAEECSSCSQNGPCFCPKGCAVKQDQFIASDQTCQGELRKCSSCTDAGPCICDQENCLRTKGTIIGEHTTCGGDQYPITFIYERGVMGRLNQILTPYKTLRTFAYNNLGWIMQISDFNKGTIKFIRNKLGLTTLYETPDAIIWNTTYDSRARPIRTIAGGVN